MILETPCRTLDDRAPWKAEKVTRILIYESRSMTGSPNEHGLVALAYASHANVNFDDEALTQLAERASEKNDRLDITGYLCYLDRDFFQYLEGPKQNVLELMEQIKKDDRHRVRNVVMLGEQTSRRFPDWHMRYINTNTLYEIQLEHVARDVLVHMNREIYGEQRLVERVCGIIDKLSQFRGAVRR